MTAEAETRDREREQRLRRQRDRFAAFAFTWGDVLLELDGRLRIASLEGPASLLLDRKSDELDGARLRNLVHADDRAKVDDLLRMAGERGRIQGEWLRLTTGAGSHIALRIAGYAYSTETGPLYLALRKPTPSERLIGDLQHANEETGLFDAEGFAQIATRRASESTDETEVTLVSLPGVEAVMERLSDDEREKLSQQFADTLKTHSLSGDSASQVGEGRYGLLREKKTDVEHLKQELMRLTEEVDPAGEGASADSASVDMAPEGEIDEAAITRSLMVTMNQFGAQSDFKLSELSHRVDGLVDQAVSQVEGFKQIVRESKFNIAVQPIVDLKAGKIHHFEGLCRFQNASGGGESPFQYLRFAEESGLIHTFDLAMVRKAVAWLSRHSSGRSAYPLAVNISGYSVGVQRFSEHLFALLDEHPWTAGRLIFEITESARMSDLESANSFIQALRKRGYSVCLDDFGAGAASFQYLSALDVDVVKLDGSAIANARSAQHGRAFLCALVELCNRVGTETIAEKIDDSDGLQFCSDCGVSFVQGFLFGTPSARPADFMPLPNGGLLSRVSGR